MLCTPFLTPLLSSAVLIITLPSDANEFSPHNPSALWHYPAIFYLGFRGKTTSNRLPQFRPLHFTYSPRATAPGSTSMGIRYPQWGQITRLFSISSLQELFQPFLLGQFFGGIALLQVHPGFVFPVVFLLPLFQLLSPAELVPDGHQG